MYKRLIDCVELEMMSEIKIQCVRDKNNKSEMADLARLEQITTRNEQERIRLANEPIRVKNDVPCYCYDGYGFRYYFYYSVPF